MTTYQSPSTAIPVGSQYQSAFPVVQNISPAQLECFSLRRTVKILCGIDIFFGLLYSFYNPYFLIPTLIAVGGYYGAKHYNSCAILTYLIFITIDWMTKLSLYIADAVSQDPSSVNVSTETWWWIFIIISTVIDIWISKIVYKYWRSLKTMPVLEITELKELTNVRYHFVYW